MLVFSTFSVLFLYLIAVPALAVPNLNLAKLASEQGFRTSYTDSGQVSTSRNVGDVNKDGFADFVVSAAGNYYLVYGSKNGLPLNFELQSSGDLHVYTVISLSDLNIDGTYGENFAGDVNGDGLTDIVLGVQPNIFIIYGNYSLANVLKITLTYSGELGVYSIVTGANSAGSSGWGSAVSGAGDINGDGFDDLVVGAPLYESGSYTPGYAQVIYGNRTLSLMPVINVMQINTLVIKGYQNEGVGSPVSAAGDVNGDGFDDMIIGAFNNAFLIFGNYSLPSTITLSSAGSIGVFVYIHPIDPNNNGAVPSASSAGDMNRDGFDDFVLGFASPSGEPNGKTFVYFGNRSFAEITSLGPPTTVDFGFNISGITTNTGYTVSNTGDITQDGFDDIIIGNNDNPGSSYVVYGNSTLTSITLNSYSGFQVNNTASQEHSVSGGGDFNGDSYPDLLITSRGNPTVSPTGYTYMVYGSKNGFIPYVAPTSQPSRQPSGQPTKQPFAFPTGQPTHQPSGQPTKQPLAFPTSQPTHQPTSQPTKQPLAIPTSQPTSQPSMQPTARPSKQPTSQPSSLPSSFPSAQPTSMPSLLVRNTSNSGFSNVNIIITVVCVVIFIGITGLIVSYTRGYFTFSQPDENRSHSVELKGDVKAQTIENPLQLSGSKA